MARPRKNDAKAQGCLLVPDNVVEIPVEEQPYPLPEGWKWVKGSSLLGPQESQKPTGDFFYYIDIDAIDNKQQKVTSPKEISVSKAPSRASRKVHEGDTIFSLVRPYLRNIAYIDFSLSNCIASTGLYICTPLRCINSRFLYWLMTSDYVVMGLNKFMKGDNSPSIRKDDIENFPFPLPPLDDQQDIVDRIESLFAKLDEAREKAQAVLDGFESRKAAILHKAFTGELTAKWREEKGFSFDSWEKTSLGKILKVSSGKGLTSKNMDNSGKIPVYGGNGITGYHNQSNVVKNTIVIGRVGYYCGSVHYIKKEAWVTDNALIVSFDRNKFESHFLFYLLLHADLRQNDSSTAQPVVSGSKIYPIEITITTNILEQQKIVRILDGLLAKDQQVTDAAESVLERIDLMKKSILAKALRGELTGQVHN